jgi:membrane protein YdbS with pleckstrin-like domain
MRSRITQKAIRFSAAAAALVLSASISFTFFYVGHEPEWIKYGLFFTFLFGGQIALVIFAAPSELFEWCGKAFPHCDSVLKQSGVKAE